MVTIGSLQQLVIALPYGAIAERLRDAVQPQYMRYRYTINKRQIIPKVQPNGRLKTVLAGQFSS